MAVLRVNVIREDVYNVIIDYGISRNLVENILCQLPASRDFFFVVDQRVYHLHGERILLDYNTDQVTSTTVVVPGGEEAKSFRVYERVIDTLIEKGMKRRSVLVPVGGGAVIDMIGFVGATFMRGIPIVNVPTTLVAQIDAAIGGKVAINHPKAKNLVGAFYNPKLVITDPGFLSTLDSDHVRHGLAEIIKTAVISSPELFEFVEIQARAIFQLDPVAIEPLITLTSELKIRLLAGDPLEHELARPLNFGHTLAHPLETVFQHLAHGDAVAIGMAAATRFALRHGLCSQSVHDRIINAIQAVGLPDHLVVRDRYQPIIEAMQLVTRIRNGAVNLVVPQEIGKVSILSNVDLADLLVCVDGNV